jgi:hypothetical protein
MTTSTRTSHRQPSRSAAIQNKNTIEQAARRVFVQAEIKAYDQGKWDAENSTRDHPPYGFSDLRQAWRLGWLAGKQKVEGLNGGSLQGLGSVVRSSAVENGK